MKKADGNLYFRRLFAYILIPFFAGPFSGGLPTPAITMRPPEASAICRSREGIRAAVLSSFGSSSAVSCRSRHTSLSSSASFPFQCRLDGRERVDEVHRRQSRVGGDIPVVILV